MSIGRASVTLYDGLSVVGTYATIQDAIGAASAGNRVVVGAGSYAAFTVNVANLTIEAEAGTDPVIAGTFRRLNHVPDDVSVAHFLETTASYTGAGNGVTIAADNVTLTGLTITSFSYAVELLNNTGLTLNDITIDESIVGVRKGTAAVVTHFTMNGGTISDTYQGMVINGSAGGAFDNVTIDGTKFENLGEKGIYAEQLSNALITNITMTNVGEFGRGPGFDIPANVGEFGVGIDINLKFGSYENITISDFTFTDVGSSSGVDLVPLDFGAAIVVKARADAPSYSNNPATLDHVVIEHGTINGTSTGIRVGEPGKSDTGATDVTITDVTVTNADVAAFENVSKGPVSYLGEVIFGAGDNNYTADAGDDTVNGGAGEDTATFTGTLTADDFSYNAATNTWTVTSEHEGTDGLVHFEKVVDGAGHTFLLVDLAGSYTTIQSAINAAADGDTLLIGAGVYDEDLNINKAVTILGAQAGVSGSDGARNAATGAGETTILGDAKITTAGDVTIDGVRFLNDASTSGNGFGNPALFVTGSGGVKTVTNSVFWSSVVGGALEDRAFATQVLSNTDINFTDNLISGSAANGYSGASWQRGFWFDGGDGVDVVMTGNVISNTRSAVNADMTGTSTFSASGNTFNTTGTAFAVGIDQVGFNPSGNTFIQVGDEYNYRNLSAGVTVDLDGDIAAISGTGGNELASVLGGNGADTISGSSYGDLLDGNNLSASNTDADVLYGMGGNDVLLGEGGDDSLNGGAGHDTLNGGAGIDTAHFDSTLTAASFVAVADIDLVTPGAQAAWTIAGDDGDTAIGIERVVDGEGHVFLLVGNGGYSTIQAALAAANDGDTIMVANGTYELGASTLTIDKEITLVGQSEAGVIINGAGIDGYGILVNADNVSLSNFTLHGPQSGSPSANYGIKVEPDTGVATDRVHNFTLENATVDNSGRAEIDLNGVVGATLTNVTVDGNGTAGVGIAITDSADVTLTDIETIDNAWGSVALYNTNTVYSQQIDNITFAGSYAANEVIGIYAEKSAPGAQALGDITFPPSFTDDGDGVWTVTNDTYRGEGSSNFTFYFADEGDAQAFALGLQGAPNTANKHSVVTDPDGNQHVFAGMSLQAAIDASDEGDSIFVHPGNYTEAANYNQADNSNSGSNPLGLLINKSVTIAGVDANGDLITDAHNVAATVTASVQSGWSTSFFVTAANVTITGLSFIGATPGGSADKVFEIVQDGFNLAYSTVGTLSGNIGSAIYINDDVASAAPGFVSDIGSFNIHDNILNGDFVLTNGPGMGLDATEFILADNDFIRNPGSDADYNWGVIIIGRDDAVAWRIASVGGELIATGNSFAENYTTDRLLFVRDDDASKLPSAQFVQDFIANNGIQTFAYGVDENGVPSVVTRGTTEGFVLAKTAGNGSSWVNSGDTLIVKTNGAPATETIVTDDLTVELLSSGLDLVMGTDVVTLALAGSKDGDVIGNAEDNIITGNSGSNNITGGTGNDELFGGAGNDVITGNSGVDVIDGGDGDDNIDGGGGRDTVYFSAGNDHADGGAGNDTLLLAGTAANYTIVIVSAGHYHITRTADGAHTEAVSFENISFISAVTLNAVNDSYTVDAGAVRTLNVRDNDSGSGVVIAANVTNGSGTATVAAGGTVVNLDLTTAYKSLDAGQTATVTVLYLLSDGSSSDTASVTVTVNGVADAVSAVADVNVSANAVSEGAAIGTVVGVTALATDADAGATVTYSLSDNADGAFQINSATGVVTTARAIDREGIDGASQTITVVATSSDHSEKSETFNIAINDVNDNAVTTPVDANAAVNIVNENAASGTLVGITANATDADAGDTNIVYSLDNNAGGAFQINSSTGVVSVAGPIDRETNASLSITVRATSPDATFALKTFVIDVNDVNESGVSTPIDVAGADNHVTENAAVGSTVGITVTASDTDATNNVVTYSLFNNAGGQFSINSVTGEVKVAGAIDREAGATRSITVRATSADTSTNDTVFVIAVGDVDEFDVTAPTDSNAAANTVGSITTLGTLTGLTASAADADSTTSAITYSLLVGDDDFDINANTGVVTVGTGFDIGGATTRLITVKATSADGSTALSNFSIEYTGGETTINGTAGKDTINGTSTRNIINGLAGNDTLNGNDGNDTINGGEGNDIINGGDGADQMVGGNGNDTYYIDNAGDTVTEIESGGARDIVYSDVSITSLFAHVEELFLSGLGNTNGTGNELANKITGNSGANVLNGGEGNDTLFGLGGSDNLFGGDGIDQLDGGDGEDTLNGGLGRDVLIGGASVDRFVFDFQPATAALADRVLDFSGDKIVLASSAFTSLAGGLVAGNIAYGVAAADGDDYLILDKATGRLFYDADGSGSVYSAQLIASFDGLTALTVADFEILF